MIELPFSIRAITSDSGPENPCSNHGTATNLGCSEEHHEGRNPKGIVRRSRESIHKTFIGAEVGRHVHGKFNINVSAVIEEVVM